MDNKNGVVDMSCFLLVEDSGDSELDSGHMEQCDDQSMDIAAGGGTDHEDDAESCSCDDIASSAERLDDFYQVILQLDDDQDQHNFIDCIEPAGTGSCRSSCSSSNIMWSIDEANLGRRCISADDHHELAEDRDDQEPRFGVKLCREVMDGMEDRLFWETCMEVGYPSF